MKRSSSQRALQGNKHLNSTLRRPATSHQRTATIRQQCSPKDDVFCENPSAPSNQFDNLQEDHLAYDDSLQTWLPFFTANGTGSTKERLSKKRTATSRINRRESQGSMVPNVNGIPTLLLATSISSGSSDDLPNDNVLQPSSLSRPSTAFGFERYSSPLDEGPKTDTTAVRDLKSRHSFSLADMFSYSSPSSRKAQRVGSPKKAKDTPRVLNSRRISSAPHPAKSGQPISLHPTEANPDKPSSDGAQSRAHGDLSETTSNLMNVNRRSFSSPLPPLKRLSSFEINLPITIPSYPNSPSTEELTSSPKLPIPSSPSILPAAGFASRRSKNHRPSGALSDRGSTLLGSDPDINRFLSSDEDDFDCRSDTVYDSTRTGATGSSQSGIRRLPIEAIFDESSTGKVPKHNLNNLQDLLSNESFMESGAHRRRITEDKEHLSTPIRTTAPCKEEKYSTPVHVVDSPLLPELLSSPPIMAPKADEQYVLEQDTISSEDDKEWSLDHIDDMQNDDRDQVSMIDDAHASQLTDLLRNSPALHGTLDPTPSVGVDRTPRLGVLERSEPKISGVEHLQESSPRPNGMQAVKNKDGNRSRTSGRRGSNALHLRSQSVPVSQDSSGHRSHHATRLFGTKGASEEWDGDFDFDEPSRTKQTAVENDTFRRDSSVGMLVPQVIMERQASVYGQFGQVKELTLLVDELKGLQQQASIQGILHGQSVELWKEAEGIINLATLDDEEDQFFPSRSPPPNGFDFDIFDEDSPSHGRRKSGFPSPKDDKQSNAEDVSPNLVPSRSSLDKSHLGTPPTSRPRRESNLNTPPTTRPRKESTAQVKSVLESIHQQRIQYTSGLLDSKSSQKKLPFDTTSLRDLVTRAGVVTRALKEIVRRAEGSPSTPKPQPPTPPDPKFSQIFHQPPPSPSISKIPRVTQSPKNSSFRGGSIVGNDNDINGHMKMMTVV